MTGSAILTFDVQKHPFDAILAECVGETLSRLRGEPVPHSTSILQDLHEYVTSDELDGVHAALYDLFLKPEFTGPYDSVCSQIVEEEFGGKAAYQSVPSVRIQMPERTSVNYHTDEWYGHGHDVQNFWLPLTPVADSNSLFVADETTSLAITRSIRGKKSSIKEINDAARSACRPLQLKFGEIYFFNSHIIHGTELNATGKTRVSFDFRMLRDGDSRGLKDESFFIRPGHRPLAANARQRTAGAVYIGKRRGFTNIISQKYQALLCNRYASENHISVSVAETELNGFDHFPTLWDMVTGTYAGAFSDVIIFSSLLLPESVEDRQALGAACAARRLTLHFVTEDIVAAPGDMQSKIESAYRKSKEAMTA